MAAMVENHADAPIFRALLTPYRSLGPKGFGILMGMLVGAWLFFGLLFWSLGAWPVFGFLGLDVLAIWLAFRWNYRQARAREEVEVRRTALDIRKVAPSGRTVAHRFNPFWTRFSVDRHDEIGIVSMAVEGEGRTVTIGSFLNPDDRETFATAFGRALATAKAG
jgi:uncharacterized membrane protein